MLYEEDYNMHLLKTLVTGAAAIAALSTPALAIEANSLRLRLRVAAGLRMCRGGFVCFLGR